MAQANTPPEKPAEEKARTLYCAQRGCSFEHKGKEPENCPVCNNPFVAHPDPSTL